MRCVVAGSGIAGMAAALLLARLGHGVTLLEAGPRLAPLLRGFVREGLHFDTGFHYGGGLHEGGVLRRWLQALGVAPALRFTDGHYDHIHFMDGASYALPAGDALPGYMETHFPGHGASMRRLMDDCTATLMHSPYTNAALHGDPAMRWGTGDSVAGRLTELHLPPHMADMLALRCLLYGVPPQRAAWEEYALVAGPYFQSSGGWEGGGAALADALEKALRDAGVDMRCRATLAGLELSGTDKRAGGVRAVYLADGTRLECEQCFFTGHPRQLAHIVPRGALRPAFVQHVLDLPETGCPLMLFAETRALPPGRNMFFLPPPGGTPGEHLFRTEEAACPSIYLACGSPEPQLCRDETPRIPLLCMALMKPELLPEGNPRPRPEAWRAYVRRVAARLAGLVEERCPELRGRWRILDTATGLSMRQWIGGSTGSLYGVLHDRENMPLLPVTRVPGLFLAGQNILLPGVLGGIVSAALAVGFAHGHEAALHDFRQTVPKETPA